MKRFLMLLIMLPYLFEISAQYSATLINQTKESVTLRCVGYGKKIVKAHTDAELSAIKTLLFVGVSGTQCSVPLIQEERTSVETRFKKFFETFYDENYKDFVETSVIVTPFGKNSLKQKCITLDVCIRVSQLRTCLEKNGIIRKFGL